MEIGKYVEPRRNDREYVEHEARERARADRRGDTRHGYNGSRAIFKTDDVSQWKNEDYCLYMRYVSEVAAEIGIDDEFENEFVEE